MNLSRTSFTFSSQKGRAEIKLEKRENKLTKQPIRNLTTKRKTVMSTWTTCLISDISLKENREGIVVCDGSKSFQHK